MLTSLSQTCKNAQQNALESANSPNLDKYSINKCIEIYLDDIDCPAVVFFDGELVYLGSCSSQEQCFQVMGDDGALFVKVNGNVLLNRIENYPLPVPKLNSTDQKVTQVEAQIANLKG